MPWVAVAAPAVAAVAGAAGTAASIYGMANQHDPSAPSMFPGGGPDPLPPAPGVDLNTQLNALMQQPPTPPAGPGQLPDFLSQLATTV